ncbi:MAG: hypothetical protein R3C15_19125 [Thermoleophilia bacterium]
MRVERADRQPRARRRDRRARRPQHPGAAPDGGALARLTLAPLRDADGAIVGALGLGREITLRKRDQLALRRLAERLGLVADLQRRILAARSVEQLAAPAVEALRRLAGAARYSVVVPEGGEWVVAAVEGVVDPLEPGRGFATDGYRTSFVQGLEGITRTAVDDLDDHDLATRLSPRGHRARPHRRSSATGAAQAGSTCRSGRTRRRATRSRS